MPMALHLQVVFLVPPSLYLGTSFTFTFTFGEMAILSEGILNKFLCHCIICKYQLYMSRPSKVISRQFCFIEILS